MNQTAFVARSVLLCIAIGITPHLSAAFPDRVPIYDVPPADTATFLKAVPSIALAPATSIANDLATALDIPESALASASIGTSDANGVAIFSSSFSSFPKQGSSFVAISTGRAVSANSPNSSGSLSTILSGLKNSQGNDLVQLTLTINVPPGAKYWAIEWRFLSEEYAEFVGSAFNDVFFIETPESTITITGNVASSKTNLALDPFGSRVSINTTGATGMKPTNAAGTTYDGGTEIVTTSGRIPEGSAQVTIIISVTDLGDSAYDTTVLLDNFRFETEFSAPPKLDPPGQKKLIPEGPISSDKPTIVLTHGLSDSSDLPGAPNTLWTGTNSRQAAYLIHQELGDKANIVSYVWSDAFKVKGTPGAEEYNTAQSYADDAGVNLAKELLKPEYLGPDYSGKIQFIGHSLGTIVNTVAARAFLEAAINVKQAQFTALDRPHHLIESAMCGANDECREYDEYFFGAMFKPIQEKAGRDLNLLVDNYFSKGGFGVGDVAYGIQVYNHPELINPNDLDDGIFPDEGASNNHSGVHQWYRWSMDPNGLYDGDDVCDDSGNLAKLPAFFDASLDPCKKGWKWSIVRSDLVEEKERVQFPEIETTAITTEEDKLTIGEYKDAGCKITETELKTVLVRCPEQSSPFGIAEVSIPPTAKTIAFDYRFSNVGDGDYVGVFIDNILIWTMAGSSFLGTEFLYSGPIPIGALTGNRALTVALYGVGEKNAVFEIKDFRAVFATANAPPSANAGPDQLVEATSPEGANVVLDGSTSMDPDGDTLTFAWSGPFGTAAGPTPTVLLPLGTNVVTLTVSDGKGGTSTATVTIKVVDTTAPTISITSPTSVAYKLRQSVAANYGCQDTASGVAVCRGPVPSGSAVDTASVGAKTFSVTAVDKAGNFTLRAAGYSVGYGICPLYDQTKAHKSGSTVPIKLQLCDANAINVSASGIVVQATGLTQRDSSTTSVVEDSGNANPDDNFRFDPALGGTGGYIFNLSTKGLSTGTWILNFTAAGDPTPHSVQFDVR